MQKISVADLLTPHYSRFVEHMLFCDDARLAKDVPSTQEERVEDEGAVPADEGDEMSLVRNYMKLQEREKAKEKERKRKEAMKVLTMQQLSDLLRIIQLALSITRLPPPPQAAPPDAPAAPDGEAAPAQPADGQPQQPRQTRNPEEEAIQEKKRVRVHEGIKRITEAVLEKLAKSLEKNAFDKRIARRFIEELSRVSLYKILYKKELEDITEKYENEGCDPDDMTRELVEIFREKFP